MIGAACLVATALVWCGLVGRGALRLRRARRQIGRLAPPVRRALPGAEIRDPCGHLLAFRCGCAAGAVSRDRPRDRSWREDFDDEARRTADLDRRPPWYSEIPMPSAPAARKG